MLFRRRTPRDREALGRLTQWAMADRRPHSELERMYGRNHADELGPLAWLFRAVESDPLEEPNLGRWQKWERELRARLALLPPPTQKHAGIFGPMLLLPGLQTAQVKTAMGEALFKGATIAAATTALTAHVLTSGMLEGIHISQSTRELAPLVRMDTELGQTGILMIDRMRLNAMATAPGVPQSKVTSLIAEMESNLDG